MTAIDEQPTPPGDPAALVGAGPLLSRSEQRSRLVRLRGPLVLGGLVGLATLALHLRDPHQTGSWGYCPWLALTGFYCPGCGGLRAVNDLGNGDLVGAASSNIVFVAAVPLLLFLWVRWLQRSWSGAERTAMSSSRSGALIAVFTVVMVVFGVVRNLPAGSWLAP